MLSKLDSSNTASFNSPKKMTHYSPIQVQVTHKIPETLSSLTESLERAKRESQSFMSYFTSVWENPILMVLKENPELTQWLLEEN